MPWFYTCYQLIVLQGLAINNGTQVIAALGAEALFRADMIAKQADIIAALTTEVLEGVPGQFDKGYYSNYHQRLS